jgi:hypothetical protein
MSERMHCVETYQTSKNSERKFDGVKHFLAGISTGVSGNSYIEKESVENRFIIGRVFDKGN